MVNLKKKPLFERPSRTKIVATLGPASDTPEMLEKLLLAGVDVFRINAAHGSIETFSATMKRIRNASESVGLPVAVLMDLAGPKIRLGKIHGDALTLHAGDVIRFSRGTESAIPTHLTCTYELLVDELEPGDRVMLADGTVELRAIQKDLSSPDRANHWVECTVIHGGTIRSRQGVNLPGVKLTIPCMLDVDIQNAIWASENGVDFLGLSFVRCADDVKTLRSLITEKNGHAQIIAKIEKPEALVNLNEIVSVSDAIMVARGDLGVETDIATVPVIQKNIIQICHKHSKAIIVATQMLESMTHSNMPTRAEVTDVANAILDGADACMLSGETAIGEYPLETVSMMHRVALGTEQHLFSHAPNECSPGHVYGCFNHTFFSEKPEKNRCLLNNITEATVTAAGDVAQKIKAKCILVATQTGKTALSLSKKRFSVVTVGVTSSEETLRRMCLYWGVIPLLVPPDGTDNLLSYVTQLGKEADLVKSSDYIVLLSGDGLCSGTRHNAVYVHEVP